MGTIQRLIHVAFALFGIGLCLLLGACRKDADEAPAGASAPAGTTAPASAPLVKVARALVIKLNVTIEVDDLAGTASRLRQSATRLGGYVSDANLGERHGDASGYLEVRIPAARLDEFRSELRGTGGVVSESEKVEDVTEARADLGARLANARAQEKRLVQLLTERTGNLGEVLLVEKELAQVRESIERLEAQQHTMEESIAMSTVQVNLRPKRVAVWQSPGSSLATAAVNGVRVAWKVLIGSGVVLLSAGPTLVLLIAMALGVVLPIRWWTRRRRHGHA